MTLIKAAPEVHAHSLYLQPLPVAPGAPDLVSNKLVSFQSFLKVIAVGCLAIIIGITRAGPATTLVIDRLRPA